MCYNGFYLFIALRLKCLHSIIDAFNPLRTISRFRGDMLVHIHSRSLLLIFSIMEELWCHLCSLVLAIL